MSLSCLFVGHDWYKFSQGQWCIRCGVHDADNDKTAQFTAALVIPSATSQPKAQSNPVAAAPIPQAPGVKAEQPNLQAITGMEDLQLERELGTGGMGTVYLMVSKRDHRRFAAKRTHLSSGESRIQFLREMQVWIDLPSHSHVLPLQFFRTLPDGLMIFTEYMAGGSMQDWLGTPKLRDLATIVDLAIQYAWGLHALHELGLIHQDVKPGNALIDNSGILKVADFGLTRARRYSDPALVVDTGSDVQATHAGMYTPPYCSPEQEQGKRLTKHTDIWSWGLSVLAMFGYAPKKKDSGTAALQILKQLETRRGKIAGVPALPKAVAEILRRCFHEQPQARWSTLLEAAQALVRLYPQLCGQAYSRPTPAFLRAAERRRIEYNRSTENLQWADPRTWLEDAMRADGRDPAETDRLMPPPAYSQYGQAAGDLILYEEAVQILERLVQFGRKELRANLAAFYSVKALIHKYLNDPAGSIEMFDRAIAIFQSLMKDELRQDLSYQLASALMNKANALLKELGKLHEAVASYDQSIAILHYLVEQEHQQNVRPDYATALMNKGVALKLIGKLSEAKDTFNQAIGYYRDLIKQEWALAPNLAMTLMNNANVIQLLGELSEAEKISDEAISIYQRLVEQDKRQDMEPNLASSFMIKANLLLDNGEWLKSEAIYDQVIDIRQRLIEQKHRQDLVPSLAMALMNKATAIAKLGRLSEAVKLYKQAIDHYQRLVEQQNRQELAPELATAFMNKANTVQQLGRLQEAVDIYEKAIVIYQRLVEQENRQDLTPDFAMNLVNKASVLQQLGQLQKAIPIYEQAIDSYEHLVEQKNRHDLRPQLAWALMNNANTVAQQLELLGQLYQLPKAVAISDKSIGHYRYLVEQEHQQKWKSNLAAAIMYKGFMVANLGKSQEAVAIYEYAIGFYRDLVEQDNQKELTGDWARAVLAQAFALMQIGNFQQAQDNARWGIPILEREIARTGRADLKGVLDWTRQNCPR